MAQLTREQAAALSPKVFRIYQQARLLINSIEEAKTTVVLTTSLGDETLAELDAARLSVEQNLDLLLTFSETYTIDGAIPTKEELDGYLKETAASVTNFVQLVKAWNQLFISRKVTDAAGRILTGAIKTGESLVASIQSVVGSGASLIKWLPVIVGVLFIGPPLLRILGATLKGGAGAGIDVSAAELERTRDAASGAASRAGQTAARAGAAYVTGGASLAVNGMRRRRR